MITKRKLSRRLMVTLSVALGLTLVGLSAELPRMASHSPPIERDQRIRPSPASMIDGSRQLESDAGEAEARSLVIAGRVVSGSSGEGIPGAVVVLISTGTATSVISGSAGAFEFQAPNAAEYYVAAVSAIGYQLRHLREAIRVDLRGRSRVDGLLLQLEPVQNCFGRVIHEDGSAAAGAGVTVDESGGAPLPSGASVVADGAGKFELPCGPDDTLEARLGDLVGREKASEEPVTVVLRATHSRPLIRGTVVDHFGSPREGVSLKMQLESEGSTDHFRGGELDSNVVSDAQGRFHLTAPIDGTWRLVPVLDGLSVGEGVLITPDSKEVVVMMASVSAVNVSVIDGESRKGVDAFEVGLVVERSRGEAHFIEGRQFVSLGGAAVAVRDIPAGPIVLWVRAPGFEGPEFSQFNAIEGVTVKKEILMRRGADFAARVRDALTLRPIPNARIEVAWRSSTGEFELSNVLRTDREGYVRVPSLTARDVLVVNAPGYRGWSSGGPPGAGVLAVELTPAADGGEGVEHGGVGISWSGSVVEGVLPEGPAELVGISAGDRLLRVNGLDVSRLVDCHRAVSGEVGTTVTLALQRVDGGTLEETVVRSRVPIDF